MANRAYLISSDSDALACSYDAVLSYEPNTEILCAASFLIPVFWLTLFEPRHIKTWVRDASSIPCPVAPMSEARHRMQTCDAIMAREFGAFGADWAKFKELMTADQGTFVKLDCAEIWDLEPKEFSERLPGALSYWSTRNREHRSHVLAIAGITDKTLFRGYSFLPDTQPPAQLHGYGWVRAVPWVD